MTGAADAGAQTASASSAARYGASLMERLPIYLNDHLTGLTAGVELARRAESSNAGSEYGEALAGLRAQVEEDRETLRDVMRRLDADEDRLKVVAGWVGEKFGRLKLNGQLLGYSPLSRLLEIEGMVIGATARRGLWRSLAALADPRLEGVDFGALESRTEAQLEVLGRLRDRAAGEALP